MNKLTIFIGLGLGALNYANAVTLVLTGPGGNTSSAVAGAHVDFYELPFGAFSPNASVVSVSVTLRGAFLPLASIDANPQGLATAVRDPSILGGELDNDTHLLFDLAQISSVTNVVETSDEFSATVNFIEPIDDAPAFQPALRSVAGEHGLTSGVWGFVYSDGSSQSFDFGIIPEPSTGVLIGLGSLGLLSRRVRIG